jgi:ADP-ribose pyrophosphatase YjhB (NUDIX family)
MKLPMQALFRIKRAVVAGLRLKTRGVKVMLFNDQGELLLVRHSYGDTQQYVFPGGGIRPFESPIAAASREMREEVSISPERLTPGSVYHSQMEGKRDTVHLFTGFTDGTPKPDGVEVVEARFFALDSLPEGVSAATLRRIQEYQGERPVQPGW